ncbi:MFS transporter [Pseudophaeobacter flagellatus]|uniref:MFS transporter n=1 Tax=Pseudophaeobacter flagellatus TaxID=2899119 RepID=UPI001E467281|nr:MFS transporter [Pseudophaeobacter flagellatus]MCD9149221.1 MFS transporter [Pseudophaeobacter flagellatus]
MPLTREPLSQSLLYPRVSLYALMLAAAGIPLYIHLPRFASVNLEIGLGTVGVILMGIRLIDLVQDPLIGWVLDRWARAQRVFAAAAALGLAFGFPALFMLQPGEGITLRLTLVLVLLFSAYSLGMILLYGRSAMLAKQATTAEITRMAAYREGGMLLGVVLVAIAPTLLALLGASAQGYPALGWGLGALALMTAVLARSIWRRPVQLGTALNLQGLATSGAARLLLLALINSLPVAITSTLFLFFVEDRLDLAGQSGFLLLLFFASAGLSVPLWARVSRQLGPRNTLLIAMPLAVCAFVGAAFLAPGNLIGFAIICLASGVALGADMVILPVMFSMALVRANLRASTAFGIWSFAGKLGLALAAFLVLPALQLSGFEPGAENTPRALATLNGAYAILPCLLKLAAIGLAMTLPTEDTVT